MRDSFQRIKPGDTVTLVAGDSDYVPVAEDLTARGLGFDVVFWNHAARELKDVATKFVSLDPYLEHLRKK